MAGTARTPFLHISHAGPNTIFAGLEDLAMTVDTFIHALVNGVAECCGAGFLDLENNIYGRIVTLVAITFYAESGSAVMTAAA